MPARNQWGESKLLLAIPTGRLPRHAHDLPESCPHKSAFFARDHCAVGLTILPCPVSSPALGSGGAYGRAFLPFRLLAAPGRFVPGQGNGPARAAVHSMCLTKDHAFRWLPKGLRLCRKGRERKKRPGGRPHRRFRKKKFVGRKMGLEPTATWATTRCSTY